MVQEAGPVTSPFNRSMLPFLEGNTPKDLHQGNSCYHKCYDPATMGLKKMMEISKGCKQVMKLKGNFKMHVHALK